MGEREVRPDHTADPRAHLIELWDGIKSRIRCESIRKLEHRFELHVPNGIDAFHPGFARGRDGPCPCRVIDERSRSGSTPFAPNKDDGLIFAQVWTIRFPSGASSRTKPSSHSRFHPARQQGNNISESTGTEPFHTMCDASDHRVPRESQGLHHRRCGCETTCGGHAEPMAQWQGCADLQCPTALMGDGGVDQFVHGLIQGKLVRIELDALWVLQTQIRPSMPCLLGSSVAVTTKPAETQNPNPLLP